jgi:uncharacterized protein (DUF885 family)
MASRTSAGVLGTLLSLGVACKPTPAPTTPATTTAADLPPDASASQSFGAVAERLLAAHFTRHPAAAVEAGLHEHDGKLRDVSAAALAAEIEALAAAKAELEGIDPAGLDARARVDRGTLLVAVRGELFELQTRRAPWKNPMFYLGDLNLTPYIAREYAPLPQRAKGVIAIASGTAKYLQDAEANLEAAIPRPWIDTALLQVRGAITFAQSDVPQALAGLDAAQKTEVDAALASMIEALKAYEAFLVGRQATATEDYALGPELFVQMLRETQGIDSDLERLRTLGEQDLERNLQAIQAAAAEVDPRATTPKAVARVIDKVNAAKPRADEVLKVATEQAEEMRAFLLDQDIVTIPTEDVAIVKESPPFMRWNAAFLDPSGPFEPGGLPSFYYISPPDPKWPKKQQKAYIPGTTDLLFITIHEVWPGHFLHGLHIRTQPSEVVKAFFNYATGEGWAHYTEEMMWNEGVSDDPKVHIGQLQNALLRNVRYLSAIGLHTGAMTVDQSYAMFRDKAFQDEANARQQAVRGTFDPMYLSYTLGKLAILKLKTDWEAMKKKAGRPATLRAFHDELLSHGAAPLPVIREAMLGPNAGPVL